VVVVGGGLAGLTAARGLDRAGRRASESVTAVDLQRDQIRPAVTRKLHV
jgi:2-polyprenyl-6-methoxyphenol hydroxylase-like FAD-dependent oxidoreductase